MSRKVTLRFTLALCLAIAGLAAFMGLLASGREQVYAAPPQAVSGEASARPAPPHDPNIVLGPSSPLAPMQNVTLTIDKKASAAVAGAPFTYTLTVTNTGTTTATNVVITDAVPTGANYLWGGGYDAGSRVVSWTVGSILSGSGSVSVTFSVTACQAVTNSLYRVVTSTQGATTTWGASLMVTPMTPVAAFTRAPTETTVGHLVHFTDTTTGPIVARRWDFGDGGTGSGQTISHTYGAAGAYTVTLTVTDTCSYTATKVLTDAVTVQAPALVLTKTVDDDTPNPGQLITYTIVVANNGGQNATGAVISDTWEPTSTLTFAGPVTLDPAQPGAILATSALSLPTIVSNVTITAGESVTVTFPVTVSAGLAGGTVITNTAAVTSSEVITPQTEWVTIRVTHTTGTRHVATAGDDTLNNCRIITHPCRTVQHAVDQAVNGDTVKVAQGIYTDTQSAGRVVSVTESITLTGGYTITNWNTPDPEANPTYLDAQGSGRVVYIAGTEITPTIEGFHIHNGSVSGINGGGVYINVTGGEPRLRGNHVYSNTAYDGGGVYLGTRATLIGNVILSNTASHDGDGVYLANDSDDARLDNNVIADNNGNGVYANEARANLRHNTIARNGTTGVYVVGTNSNVVLTNTIIASHGTGVNVASGNATLDHTLWHGNTTTATGATTTNDSTGDPDFVAPDAGDYHIGANSAAINEGVDADVLDDIDGETRDAKPDLGADEHRTCWAHRDSDPTIDYTTVQDAVDEANANDVVKVAGYCRGVFTRTVSGNTFTQTVYVSQSLTLQGGYTVTNWITPNFTSKPTVLDAQGKGRVVYVTNTAAITVEGFHIINGLANSDGGGVYVNAAGGEATLQDNRVYSNTATGHGGGLYLTGTLTVTLSDIHIYGNETITDGGGIYLNGTTATLSGTHVYSNTATNGSGGGLYLDISASAALNDDRVYGNTAGADGGGLYLTSATTATLNGTHVYSNTATNGSGGGLYLDISTSAALTGDHVYSNAAGADGGGIYLTGDTATLSGTHVYSNTAGDDGGGLYLDTSNDARLNDGTIFGNAATNGGGLYLDTSDDAELNGTHVYSNTASTNGGGLYLLSSANAALTGTRVCSNTASTDGGGLYLLSSDNAALNSSRVCSNTASTGDGGGLYLGNSDNATLNSTRICSNTANDDGGGLYLWNSNDATLTGNIIIRNTVRSSDGAGFYLWNSDNARLDNNIIADNQGSGEGSGVYVNTGLSAYLSHNTLARNAGSSGIYVINSANSVVLTNTIVATHTVGIKVNGDTVNMNGVLWSGNQTNTLTVSGGTINVNNATPGTPAFVNPDVGDYHIGAGSMAINNGVASGLPTDIDGDARDASPDLGADEYRACKARINDDPTDYASVQAAVNAAGATAAVTDVVKVAGYCSGVFTRTVSGGAVVTQTVFISTPLTLQGGFDHTDWNATPDPIANPTYLDAQGLGRVIYITTTGAITVDGFHICNGHTAGDGGGVYVVSAIATLKDNRIYSNTAGANGGGLYLNASPTATLSGNEVYSNTANDGGGLCLNNSDGAGLSDNAVYNNTAGVSGGGLYLWSSANAELSGNAVYNNTASTGDGGGLYLNDSPTATLSRNTIHDNAAQTGDGGGVYILNSNDANLDNNIIADNQATDDGGGVYLNASTADLRHNTIARNTGNTGVYINDTSSTVVLTNTIIATHTTGIHVESGNATLDHTLWHGNGTITTTGVLGNITTISDTTGSPDFVNPGAGDYHIGAGSKAIDEGVDAGVDRDIDGEPRDANPDLGADEYQYCLARINDDPTEYTSVQAAVDDSTQPADVVKVSGYCVLTQAVQIDKSLTLQGGYAHDNWITPDPKINTTLDAQGPRRVVYVTGTSTVTLAGFRIISGTEGVAIQTATVTISRCRIYDNSVAGVVITGGDLTLERTWVYNNAGDGVKVGSTYRLDNDVIAQNGGVGLRVTGTSTGTLRHNTFARNTDGGAIIVGAARFTNTIFYSHTTCISVTAGTAYLSNTLWSSCTHLGTGNVISSANYPGDPDFVDQDCHIGANSAAVNVGVDAGLDEDIDGDPRPIGGYDLGADELGVALSVVKYDDPDPVEAGTQLTYTIYVTNTGGASLTATITDTLRQGGAILQQDVWTPTISAPGGVWSETVVITVGTGCSGTLANEVWVTTSEGATDIYTELTDIVGVTVAPYSPTTQYGDPGEQVTYTLRLTNTGSAPATFTVTVSGNLWPTDVPTNVVLGVCAGSDVPVTVTVPSTATSGAQDVAMVEVEGPAGVTDASVLTTTVSQPESDWVKEVYVNGTLAATSPINVTTGDAISIVDRVWITYTVPVTFTLVETWTDSLILTGVVTDTGNVVISTDVLTWTGNVIGGYAITKTFEVTGTSLVDYVTETLVVEGADPIAPRVLTFRNAYTLTVAITGSGTGTVTVVPTSTTGAYPGGTIVTLVATASLTSTFDGWSGAVVGMTNPVTITMDSDKVVTATFTSAGPTFSLTPTADYADTPYAIQVFTLTLTNNDAVADTFLFTDASTSTSALPYPDNLWNIVRPVSITVGAGLSATVRITVEIPGAEVKWVTHTATISATSQNHATVVTSTLTTFTGGHWDPVDSRWEGCRFDFYDFGQVIFADAITVYNHIGSTNHPQYEIYHFGQVIFADAMAVYDRIGTTCAP